MEQAVKKGASEEEEKARTQVETVVFGSYMLGVHSPGTDIDVILVFRSKFVSQKEFLVSFVKHVQSLEDFYGLQSISQAKVPIVKVHCGSIQFDILFACIDELRNVHKLLKTNNLTNVD